MVAQWQWQSDNKPWNIADSIEASWTSYLPEENSLIEQAYLSASSKPVVIRNYYVVDFQKMVQYVEIAPTHQRSIRRLSNYQTIDDVHMRKNRFVFSDNETCFFQPFEVNVKVGSLMVHKWHKQFIESHRRNGRVTEKDIVDAAIQGIEQEGLRKVEFKKEATEICDELRKVRNCGNKLDIKKCAVRLYTGNGMLPSLVNKALREDNRRVYQNSLGPFCYLIYSYLSLRDSFDIYPYRGTVYRGARLQPGMIGRFQKKMKEKKGSLTWVSFTSTTKNRMVADIFSGNTLFEILLSDDDYFTSQGIDISHLSKMPDEEEVLLPPGFQFDIVDIQTFEPTINKPFIHYLIQLLPRQLRDTPPVTV